MREGRERNWFVPGIVFVLILVPILVAAQLSAAASKKELKVGVICSLSGPASQWGVGFCGGVQIGVVGLLFKMIP